MEQIDGCGLSHVSRRTLVNELFGEKLMLQDDIVDQPLSRILFESD